MSGDGAPDPTHDTAPSASAMARRFGAPRAAAVPRMEHVRATDADPTRRPALQKTRSRLVMAASGFGLLFGAVVLKLADATVLEPVRPKREVQIRRPDPPPPPGTAPTMAASLASFGPRPIRAAITDRNGEILAISLPTASVIANPKEMIDPADAAHKIKSVLAKLDEADIRRKLSDPAKQFVYLARHITPREQLQLNALGIPGLDFEPTERRRYPLGRVAAHVLGGVNVDGGGVAGVEKFFDQRLHDDPEPLRLSLDVRVQAVVRDELTKAISDFNAIGGCGIVLDVRTGEVVAMVSLPDYDANELGKVDAKDVVRFNRTVTGIYEPGSTFKLQTASLALDTGTVQLWNGFDASGPIHIGRFTIQDFEGKHRWLYVPEILAYSSNIGAARMAEAVGGERQRQWMDRMGMLSRIGIELPETSVPQAPAAANWKEIATLTIGFGHGISVSPLHVVTGTAAIANGGILYRPTLLASPPSAPPRQGFRVMQQSTSDTMRKLMRLVVTDGYGKTAEAPGYYVGGKTGTAEKATAHGYKKHTNVAAFMSAFPMNAPRYAVYMMLDEPKANASTHGYATAGWVAAPAAGRVIGRIGPMLGLLPEIENAPAINAQLAIPLQPGRPAGAKPSGNLPPVRPAAPPAGPPMAATPRPEIVPVPAANPPMQPPRDLRHEASYVAPALAVR